MDEKIRIKLEALMRLAEDPNATEHERELAQQRVSEFITKFQIDAAQIDPHSGRYQKEEIVSWSFTLPTKHQMYKNRSHGLYQVIRAFGADAYAVRKDDYTVPGRGKGRAFRVRGAGEESLTIFATESTMETLKFLLPSLLMQEMAANEAYIRTFKATDPTYLENLAAQKRNAWWANQGKNDNLALIRRHRISFAAGWYASASRRMRATRDDVVQNAGDQYALVLVDTEARIKEMMGEGHYGRSRSSNYNGTAWGHGSEAGKRADVGNTRFEGGRKALM